MGYLNLKQIQMKYIEYYRVSTEQQGNSGLGLETQRTTVLNYIKHNGNELVAEFTEAESGKNDKRPELLRAIQTAKNNEGTLVYLQTGQIKQKHEFYIVLDGE